MKNFITSSGLIVLLLFLLPTLVSAQSNYWQMTLFSGEKITHFSFRGLSEDSLLISLSDMKTKIAIDSIKEIRYVKKSHVLAGMGIGIVAGTAIAAILIGREENPETSSGNPAEEKFDELGRGLSSLGGAALGMILGAAAGAMVGSAMGEDTVYDFSLMTPTRKMEKIAYLVKENTHKKGQRENHD